MRHLRFALVATFLCIAATAPVRADEACQLGRVTSVAMTIDAAGGAYVPMTISGQSVNLLIDTGGIQSMLTTASVTALGLHSHDLQRTVAVVFGGARIDHVAAGHDIEFGGLKAPNMDFLVMPDGLMASGVGGTLAPDVLLAYDDDFDFAHGTFNLFSMDHCPGRVVYWTQDGHAAIPFHTDQFGHIDLSLQLDGKDVRSHVDTGASRSVLSLELAEELFGFDLTSPLLKSVDASNVKAAYRYPFKTLTFGGVTVSNPDILLVPDSQAHLPGSQRLILGMGVLRQLHVYIANSEKILYVTPAAAH